MLFFKNDIKIILYFFYVAPQHSYWSQNVVSLLFSLSNRIKGGKDKCYFIKKLANMKSGGVAVSLQMHLTFWRAYFWRANNFLELWLSNKMTVVYKEKSFHLLVCFFFLKVKKILFAFFIGNLIQTFFSDSTNYY